MLSFLGLLLLLQLLLNKYQCNYYNYYFYFFLVYLFIYLFIHLFVCYLFIHLLSLSLLFFLILLCQQGNSRCIIVLYNGGSKTPIRLSGKGRSCLVYLNLGRLCEAQCRRRYILAYSTQFLIRIRLVPGNAVMVATDMYGKSPYGSGYTELRESMTFLPFLFSFLINSFYNFSYIFTLHHCSAIC